MTNRLANESSPYLLQHQENPVDWYPWGPEALARSKSEERPIFLSIGYSACHWCHVMEHESFENEEIASLINEKFIPIKVDREERPDLDQVYMTAVQLMTGHGGWPMSVFLTPDLKPFYGGTYWPPHAARGMPGFDQVLNAVDDAWSNRRPEALETASQLTEQLQQTIAAVTPPSAKPLGADAIQATVAAHRQAFDATHGGFGGAPKFPQATLLRLLLRHWQRTQEASVLPLVTTTLDRMAAGGIYDHLGGGFARYSVDARWLVPHFEKMLYDNAQLAMVYLEAYQATGQQAYAAVVRATLDYVLRDMTDPAGGFYSAEDADSEGVEGKFYTWDAAEVNALLGPDRGEVFCKVYDVSEIGNFEGTNILHLAHPLSRSAAMLKRPIDELESEMRECREILLAAREKRVRPGRDDKVLVSWNGLMIDALAGAGAVLGEEAYLAAARKAADFILATLREPSGRLLHTWRCGEAKIDAYLDDYACLINALVSLYEATWETAYVEAAVELADDVMTRFADADGPGLFFTSIDHESLLTRNKDFTDASVPSGNGMMATALLRLGRLADRSDFRDAAGEILQAGRSTMERIPWAAGQLLLALDFQLGPAYEVVLSGSDRAARREAESAIRAHFFPAAVFAVAGERSDEQGPLTSLLAGKASAGKEPVLHLCQEYRCASPIKGLPEIVVAVENLAWNRG